MMLFNDYCRLIILKCIKIAGKQQTIVAELLKADK